MRARNLVSKYRIVPVRQENQIVLIHTYIMYTCVHHAWTDFGWWFFMHSCMHAYILMVLCVSVCVCRSTLGVIYILLRARRRRIPVCQIGSLIPFNYLSRRLLSVMPQPTVRQFPSFSLLISRSHPVFHSLILWSFPLFLKFIVLRTMLMIALPFLSSQCLHITLKILLDKN